MAKKGNILNVIGDNIRKNRLLLNISQDQLAFEAGLSREFINKVEAGKHNISIIKLERIAEVLNIDLVSLFNK